MLKQNPLSLPLESISCVFHFETPQKSLSLLAPPTFGKFLFMKLFRFGMTILSGCLLAFTNLAEAGQKHDKITLPIDLGENIAHIITSAIQLQDTLYNQDELASQSTLSELLAAVVKARDSNTRLSETQRLHLEFALDRIQYLIKTIQEAGLSEQKDSIKEVLSQIVHIVHSYEITLNKIYVFFCSEDSSVWLQQDRKTKNPFQPKSRCGRLLKI